MCPPDEGATEGPELWREHGLQPLEEVVERLLGPVDTSASEEGIPGIPEPPEQLVLDVESSQAASLVRTFGCLSDKWLTATRQGT